MERGKRTVAVVSSSQPSLGQNDVPKEREACPKNEVDGI